MKNTVLVICCILLFSLSGNAQFQVDWNANIDFELSSAGSDSHYWYNDIHRTTLNPRFDISRADFILGFQLTKNWKINTHAMLKRLAGQRAGIFQEWDVYRVVYPRLNIQWSANDAPWSVIVGRLMNPFGQFYENQRFIDRDILDRPLAYSYHFNISSIVGFVPNLVSDNLIPGDWGHPMLSRLGYLSGIQVQYDLAEKMNFSALFAKQAPNIYETNFLGEKWSLIGRFSYRFNYFTKVGISVSYSPFVEERELNAGLNLNQLQQSVVGLDYSFGYGFWSLSGEIIGAWYTVPIYDTEAEEFLEGGNIFTLFGASSYTDLKYEWSFLPGSYIAYRLDLLLFGDGPDGNGGRAAWNQNVTRHAITLGYKINSFWEVKLSLSDQNVEGRNWDQSKFRLMTSFFW